MYPVTMPKTAASVALIAISLTALVAPTVAQAAPTIAMAKDDQAATGRLKIRVSGLPDGVNPTIRVVGPKGFSRKVVGSVTLRKLAPGRYTVTASQVSADSSSYQPQKGTMKARVQAGEATQLMMWFQEQKQFIGLPPLPPLPST